MSQPVLSQAWALHGFSTSHGPRTYPCPCPCHALPLKRHSDSSLCLRSAQICPLCGEIGLLNTEIRTMSVTDLVYFGSSINTPLFPISGTVTQWSFPSRTFPRYAWAPPPMEPDTWLRAHTLLNAFSTSPDWARCPFLVSH